jgi:cob(I)alamin adenosyltransferase
MLLVVYLRMTLYTRSGDDGTTGLFGAGRVAKDDDRVAAYGEVDELNAALGLVAAACDESTPTLAAIRSAVLTVQNMLFDLGADFATPHGSAHEQQVHRLSDAAVQQAEKFIDEFDGANEPLKQFILPGGSELASRLHLARTVCRRAERAVVRLRRTQEINETGLVYLNRVSDLLFAMARQANAEAGVPDVPWIKSGDR